MHNRAHSARQTLGFLADARRVNVSLTRARQTLWVLGDVDTLGRSEVWRAFVLYCRRQGYVVPVPASWPSAV